jgi:hypothetical protein
MVAVVHKFIRSWCDLQVKAVVFFEADINRNHHDAEFYIPVSVLNQSTWKFCVYRCLGLVALLPVHQLLHTIVVHIFHLLMESNHRILCMASNVL